MHMGVFVIPFTDRYLARIGMAAVVILMDRTIPSFRIAFGIGQAEWKPFHNALDN